MRLLIVEDDRDIQRYYENAAKAKSIPYDIVNSRVEAITKLKHRCYEAAIVDLQLTDDNSYSQGIEVLKYIAATEEGTNAVVVSGTPNPQDIINSYEGGAVKVIAKADKSYTEIGIDIIEMSKNVELHNLGNFASLNAYLAFPENAIFFENTLNNILRCGHQKLNMTIYKSFNKFLPVLRHIGTESSFTVDSEHGIISGTFWSKRMGYPFIIAFMQSDNQNDDAFDLPEGAIPIEESDPVKGITVKTWKITNADRNDFYEFINDIGKSNDEK